MRQLGPEKLKKLNTFNKQLDEEFGEIGSDSREKFHEEALAWLKQQ